MLLLVMSSSHDERLAVGRALATDLGCVQLDAPLPPPDSSLRASTWTGLAQRLRSAGQTMVVTAPPVGPDELDALRGVPVETIWLRRPEEDGRNRPGTLVIDATMPVLSIVATVRAVLRLAANE